MSFGMMFTTAVFRGDDGGVRVHDEACLFTIAAAFTLACVLGAMILLATRDVAAKVAISRGVRPGCSQIAAAALYRINLVRVTATLV